MGLVEDDRVILIEVRIALRFGQQDTVGHQLDEALRPDRFGEADLVAHVAPRGEPISSAIRAATLRAAIRRGCVWPIRPATPRPMSRQIFGNCVDLPEPVSPQTITTWCSRMAAAMSSRRAEIGRSASKVSLGTAFRRASQRRIDCRSSSSNRASLCCSTSFPLARPTRLPAARSANDGGQRSSPAEADLQVGGFEWLTRSVFHLSEAPSWFCSRHHCIVSRRPSSNGVAASNPNSRARLVSRQRRGCPSGLSASQTTFPRYPARAAIFSVSSRMLISNPAPTFTGSGPS